jgi:hypothetical protein
MNNLGTNVSPKERSVAYARHLEVTPSGLSLNLGPRLVHPGDAPVPLFKHGVLLFSLHPGRERL